MSPRGLMILGSLMFAMMFFVMMNIAPTVGAVSVMLFGAGMLFGKGYGVWEERCRRGRDDSDPAAWRVRSMTGTSSVKSTHIFHNETAADERIEELFDRNYFGRIEKTPLYAGKSIFYGRDHD